MDLWDVLAVVGLVWVARWVLYVVLDVVAALRKFVWARLSKDNLPIKYGGKWAVVTGCTDGIGKEYARQLAQRGMNILLIARNKDKLSNVKQLIKEESPGVETETVQVDFGHGRVIYPEIARHLTDKNIGILVNNVGMVVSPPTLFVKMSEDDIWNYVNVNVASVVAMTQLVLPKMLAKNRGAIITVSSIASGFPSGIYSATKVFGDFFSESLRWECQGTGVEVQTIRPGLVATNLSRVTKSTLFAPTASDYVTSALSTLGHAGHTTGFWPHGVQAFLIDKVINASAIRTVTGFVQKNLGQRTSKKE